MLESRDRSYVHNYSEYCQSQANANQATWKPVLDQYQKDVERERQRQEQQRITQERQRQQQLERQYHLERLEQWHSAAIALGKPADYVERIRVVTADYQRGLPLSEKSVAARTKDLADRERQIQRQQPECGRGLSR